MNELLMKLLMEKDAVLPLVQKYVEEYKPVVYGLLGELVKVLNDYAENEEYFAIIAKKDKTRFDAYINAGFTADQAMALMLNSNLQLLDNLQKINKANSASKK